MISFITRYFTSLFALLTSPFRATWRVIRRVFPEREFTVMDTPNGNVYSFHQTSFWRFTKFVGKITLIIWATWSTYVFVYHRPLLQKRTQQLEQARMSHARQISDLTVHLQKFNDLVRDLNSGDDKLLNAKKLSQTDRDAIMQRRVGIWGELSFLQTRLDTIFTDVDYVPEFRRMSELSMEYDLIRAQNEELLRQNQQITETMIAIADADNKIVDTVSKLSTEKIGELRDRLKPINSTIVNLGLSETALAKRANKFSSGLVGGVFTPIVLDKDLDPKYQKLADDLELWHGLARMRGMLPTGAPVKKMQITSNYGTRNDPFTGKPTQHKGVDFAGGIGTELFAIAPGRVVSAGERVGYGQTVEIDHGLGFSTLYAHLSKIHVSRGEWVRPGTLIGLGGNSGRSTGPHLHYEIRYNGNTFNPSSFIKGN